MRSQVRMTKPCENCPFRNDKPLYLSAERAEGIANALKSNGDFACHKTCDHTDEGVSDTNASFCAGAIGTMVGENRHLQNVLIRIMMQGQDPSKTGEDRWPETIDRSNLFESLTEWVDAHYFDEEE